MSFLFATLRSALPLVTRTALLKPTSTPILMQTSRNFMSLSPMKIIQPTTTITTTVRVGKNDAMLNAIRTLKVHAPRCKTNGKTITKKAVIKRFRLTGSDNLKCFKGGMSHNTGYKKRGRKNLNARSTNVTEGKIEKRIRKLMGC